MTFIMSDKVLQSISKSAEDIKAAADLKNIIPPFTLLDLYGAEVYDIIVKAKSAIYEKYIASRTLADEQQRKREEVRQVDRRTRAEENERRKRWRAYESRRKKHETIKARWNAHREKVARGDRIYGKAPREPSLSPEPPE
jgi:hypothetical protein